MKLQLRQRKLIILLTFLLAISLNILGCGGGSGGTSNSGSATTYEHTGEFSVVRNQTYPTTADFAGTYNGKINGDDQSNIVVICCDDGQIFFYSYFNDEKHFGKGTITMGGIINGTFTNRNDQWGNFDGNCDANNINGNIVLGNSTGTWTASVIDANNSLPSVPGSYAGTISGDDSGQLEIGIGSDGSIIGIVQSPQLGFGGITAYIENSEGSFSGYFDNSSQTGAVSGKAVGSSVNGYWATNDRL